MTRFDISRIAREQAIDGHSPRLNVRQSTPVADQRVGRLERVGVDTWGTGRLSDSRTAPARSSNRSEDTLPVPAVDSEVAGEAARSHR